MVSREKTRKVFLELINLQLKPHGKTYDDVVGQHDWYMKFNTTREKEQDFIKEAIKIVRTKLRMNKSIAEKEVNWFILQWGLTTAHADTEALSVAVKEKKRKKQ